MRFKSNTMLNESSMKELEKNLHQQSPNDLKAVLKRLVPEHKPYLE